MVQIKRTEQSQTSLPQTQNFQFAFQSQGRQLADFFGSSRHVISNFANPALFAHT